MSYNEFSVEFNAFRKLRDKSVSGLEKVDVVLNPDDLIKRGYKLVNSKYFSEGNEEHEFHEYQKDAGRIVFLQTYLEKEGGMYIQTFYSSPELIKDLEF